MGDAVLLWWFHGDAWEKLKKPVAGGGWNVDLVVRHGFTHCVRRTLPRDVPE